MSKTPWKKIVSDPIYIGEADFEEGEEKIATIDRVASDVKVKSAEGTSEKSVVYFREKDIKPMILNVARSKAIAKVANSRFVEDWAGVPIQLYVEDGIKAFGDIVSAVRVRPKRPNVQQQKKVLTCEDCGSVIQGVMGKGADYIAAYTQKRYGATLCYACGLKRAEAAAPKTEEGANEQAEADRG
jgi:hypothetical protein